jgi:sec-independent protein translocase protein TatB
VFGFSFGELVVLVIVAIVVIGPKDMPKVLRKMGQFAGKLRRMASDIRTQSGIDEVLRGEGIAEDIAEIRKLARGEMDNVTRAATLSPHLAGVRNDPYLTPAAPARDEILVHREREYPLEGADSYKALPDTALVYARALPRSPLARDPLYIAGDADAVLPAEAEDLPAAEAAPDNAPEQPQHDA